MLLQSGRTGYAPIPAEVNTGNWGVSCTLATEIDLSPSPSNGITNALQRTTFLTQHVQGGATGERKPPTRPFSVKPIGQRCENRPCCWCVQPTQTNQAIGLAEHRDIRQDVAIGAKRMNTTHRLAITNTRILIRVVIISVDVHKAQTLELIAAAQKIDLPHTEGTSTVEQQGEKSIGLLGQGNANTCLSAWRTCSASGDLLYGDQTDIGRLDRYTKTRERDFKC